MEQALGKLEKERLKDALSPEREAYQNLLRAEAQIKSFQMQRAQAQGIGSGATLDELAQLFEDEMDKLNNKYETLRQNQQRQAEQQTNEALQKVKELARRQQQFNQKVRNLARKDTTPEEKKRQIEELRRQQERLSRETQELARQMRESRRQGTQLPREVQENLRQASSEMQNASNKLRQDNPELAAAKGTRALNKLKRLEESLRRNLNDSLRQQFESLQQDFQKLAESQKELTKDVEDLTNKKENDDDKRQQAEQKQGQVREDLSKVQSDLQFLTSKAQEAKKAVTRDLKRLSREMAGAKIDKKMEHAQQLLEDKRLHSALQAERDIQTIIERMSEKLRRLQGEFAETDEEKLDLALGQTQRLREELESLKRQFHESGQGHEISEGEEQSGKAENVQVGPGESRLPPQIFNPEQIEAWSEELAQSLKDLEFIKEAIQVDTSLSKQLSQINRNFQGVFRNFAGGNPEKLSLIEERLLVPLKNFEAELAQKLELLKNKDKLFLAREEKIPPEYKELVEKYYEALSKTK
jgi:DNA repair exonuclease SbcCD ATPase subunit